LILYIKDGNYVSIFTHMFVNMLFKDVYVGNGEFSREKRVVNGSTVDIVEVYKTS